MQDHYLNHKLPTSDLGSSLAGQGIPGTPPKSGQKSSNTKAAEGQPSVTAVF